MNSEVRDYSHINPRESSRVPPAKEARVLAFADWYLPGYKAGGLVSALSNLVELVGDEFEFFIFTRDRDFHEARPYAEVPLGEWTECGKARALYTNDLSAGHLRRRIFEVQPDLLYLNSFFSPLTFKTLSLLRLGFVPRIPALLAPRGEFSPAALTIKRGRKQVYLAVARASGLLNGVCWQASSVAEERQIRTMTGDDSFVRTVSDAPERAFFGLLQTVAGRAKPAGAARFLFLSRISRNKNLDFALRVLSGTHSPIEFEICGPVGDEVYWRDCQRQLAAMPGNISTRYRGSVSRTGVPAVLKEGHFLLLPTGGENFGYAILEALAAGCPVIISDQTPWQGLEKQGVGWTLPLNDANRWRAVLDECVAMDTRTYAAMSARARHYAREWILSTPFHVEHRRLFEEAVQGFAGTRNAANDALPAV